MDKKLIKNSFLPKLSVHKWVPDQEMLTEIDTWMDNATGGQRRDKPMQPRMPKYVGIPTK